MKDNQLTVIAQESGLAEPQIQGLLSKFGETFANAQNAIEHAKGIAVTSEDQTAEMDEARFARLELKNIRVATEHTRKELKEQSLREGKAIDGMANIIKAMIVPVEEYLEKQEKFAENLAKERHAKMLAERLSMLLAVTDSPDLYAYKDMTKATFAALIADLKAAKVAQEVAAKKAEADRLQAIEDAKIEQERIRQENAKLKAEAEARELALAKERKQAEAQRLALEEKARKERALIEAKLKAEQDARAEAEKLEAERVAAEARKVEEEANKQKAALLAPDKEKLLTFANTIDTLQLPNVANREAGKLLDETKDFLNRISKNLKVKAKEL